MQKNLGKIKRTVEEYVVLTVATLILASLLLSLNKKIKIMTYKEDRKSTRLNSSHSV